MSTKSQHTPGPWGLAVTQTPIRSTVNFIHAANQDGSKCVIADCGIGLESPKSRDECEANARLISAAPELLKALQGLLSQIEFNEPLCLGTHYLHATREGNCHETRIAFALARAALAKAEGSK